MAASSTRNHVATLALAGALALCGGCAFGAMTPLPATHTVEQAPRCTESSGSIAMDVLWGIGWGVPSLVAFSSDEGGLGLGLGLLAAIHVASAVTGVKRGETCKKARLAHDTWLTEQRGLLRNQRRANRALRKRNAVAAETPATTPAAPSTPSDDATATTPTGSKPAATTVTSQVPPAPTSIRPGDRLSPAPSRTPPRPSRRVRPRNSDPWAEFWQEVSR